MEAIEGGEMRGGSYREATSREGGKEGGSPVYDLTQNALSSETLTLKEEL